MAFDACQKEGPTILCSLGSMVGSGGTPSQASQLLQKRFGKAAEATKKDSECVAIIFMDECDALLSSDAAAGMLAPLLDRTSQGLDDEGWHRIMAVAATNHDDKLPTHLMRPGRFDKQIHVAPPTAVERATTLKSPIDDATSNSSTLGPETTQDLAEECVGCVAADLVSLVRRVVALALEEGKEVIDLDHFQKAMLDVPASALRDSTFSAPPKTQWSDIAGDPGGALKTLKQAIEWPRTKRCAFKNLGLQPPKGILLHGPPGCAKTTLARAAAGAAASSFIAFAPSDVFASSHVGEAESIVRNAFKLARSTSPCILFFDELDSITGNEGPGSCHGVNRSGGSSAGVLSTFLNELDGVDGSWEDGVIALGATNRPWTLDEALPRSGRFDKAIYAPPPDYNSRLSILKMFCQNSDLRKEDLEHLASDEVSGSMTGAELVGDCRAAGMKAFKEATKQGGKEGRGGNQRGKEATEATATVKVTLNHLKESLTATQPLLSEPGCLEPFLEFERSRMKNPSLRDFTS